jgi:putative DNA methylase
MTDKPRLIERAFPLKQTSLTSVHEKNVRHGHISTLHIWPARRPLAACRAALIATLLPDPGTPEERQKLCERIGGRVVQKVERKKMPNGSVIERVKEEVEGGILGWIGTEPKSGGKKKVKEHRDAVEQRESELAWFRDEIKKAYGGRAPRVLDPFAGGGAIPLEAMRLGCEATAADINPVAWFILKCTLEHPQKLAGKTHPLPDFILEDDEFMEAFYRAHPHLVGRTKKTKKQISCEEKQPGFWDKPDSGRAPKADLAWHVRAWGRWVLNEARRELAPFYPTYANFEPLDTENPRPYEKQAMRLVPLKEGGTADIDALNAEFSKEYLRDKRNPRWVAKPTVAYLWARTVKCKNCRAVVPLLKTRWLCKKDKKRVLLSMNPNADGSGVEFGVQKNVPAQGGNAAQKREHDKRLGAGTMSRAGTQCPCCATIMTMEDIRFEGKSGRLDVVATAVVTESQTSKSYRLPTKNELECSNNIKDKLALVYSNIPLGMINEPFSPASTRSISCQLYGINSYKDFFTARQHLALGIFISAINRARVSLSNEKYPLEFQKAIIAYMCVGIDRLTDYSNAFCSWDISREGLRNLLGRYSISITWDFCEINSTGDSSGSFACSLDYICSVIEHLLHAEKSSPLSNVLNRSSTMGTEENVVKYDLIMTDPPYYEAISYADLSELFYVVLRRVMNHGSFSTSLMDKTNEVVQHIHPDKDSQTEKKKYESMMAGAFRQSCEMLSPDGRFVIVFAHKHPNAWETLVTAMISAGFVVDSSWPIQTEMSNRTRGLSAAALASSVWLVCKKRPIAARPGWDNKVLEEMRANITERLHAYWDAGIRGPDFVWAATGPALEAYSKHPIVKKANTPGEVMGVGEFLSLVRRMVVDFVVGQVLTGQSEGSDMAAADRMDAPTAYYLLHRHDFGLDEAPAGACILYATACGLSDRDLESAWDLVSHKGASASSDDDGEEADPDAEDEPEENSDSGSMIKLKTWAQRNRRSMGFEAPSGRPIPLIDRIHRLMHLWRAGDVHKVDEYLDDNGLRRQELFKRLVQSLIELSSEGSEERSLLESLSNHVQAKGATVPEKQIKMAFDNDDIANSDKEK